MKNMWNLGYGVLLVIAGFVIEKITGYRNVNIIFSFVVILVVLLFIKSGALISGDRVRANFQQEEDSELKLSYRTIILTMIPLVSI